MVLEWVQGIDAFANRSESVVVRGLQTMMGMSAENSDNAGAWEEV